MATEASTAELADVRVCVCLVLLLLPVTVVVVVAAGRGALVDVVAEFVDCLSW